jgi:ATP-dependent DNA helicase RecG
MERYTSGFDISEADLKIRGPGDFLGTRQSGMPDFRIGNILRDEKILKEAREDAFALVAADPELSSPENKRVGAVLKERWKGRLEFAGVG